MSENLWLWAWGAAGALLFAGTALGVKLFADPGDDSAADRRRRNLALFSFTLAVLTGAVTAQLFAATVEPWIDRLVDVSRSGAAFILGAAANTVWPKIVRLLGERVDQLKLPPPGGSA